MTASELFLFLFHHTLSWYILLNCLIYLEETIVNTYFTLHHISFHSLILTLLLLFSVPLFWNLFLFFYLFYFLHWKKFLGPVHQELTRILRHERIPRGNPRCAALEDKERPEHPKKFEDEKLEELLNEDSCQTIQELSTSLRVDQSTVGKLLKSMEMINKVGH